MVEQNKKMENIDLNKLFDELGVSVEVTNGILNLTVPRKLSTYIYQKESRNNVNLHLSNMTFYQHEESCRIDILTEHKLYRAHCMHHGTKISRYSTIRG